MSIHLNIFLFQSYIVLAVRALTRRARKLQQLVSRLYSSALGKTVSCSLLAMTKKLNETSTRRYIIRCVLCQFNHTEDKIRKWKREEFEIHTCGRSKVFTLDSCITYCVTFELVCAKLLTKVNQFPLRYQADHDCFVDTLVEASGQSQDPVGTVFLLKKRLPPAKIRELTFGYVPN